MLALRTLAILCSALTETAAVQIDSDLATTIEVDAAGQYVFSIVSDGGSRLLIDGAVVIDDAATHPLGPVPSDPTFLTLGTHALEIQLVECCNGTPGGPRSSGGRHHGRTDGSARARFSGSAWSRAPLCRDHLSSACCRAGEVTLILALPAYR